LSEMRVGGAVSLAGPIEFENIDVGGSLKVKGDLTVRGSMKIGGSASIEGNLKAGRVKIGGSISVQGKIEAKELTIGGAGSVGEGVIGELLLGGSLKAGRLYVGKARISGKFTGVIVGKTVIVEKKSKVKGIIIAGNLVARRNSEIEEAYAVEAEVERGAEISKLHCVKCVLGKKSWIGLLRYKESYRDEGSDIDRVEEAEDISELDELKGLEDMFSGLQL